MNSRNVRAWTRYAIVVALLVVVLSPALWLVLMSFRPHSDIMATTLTFRPTLHNYAEAWTGEFPASFGHSLSASLASTVVSLSVGVPAAYVLARCGSAGSIRWRCGFSSPVWRRRLPSRYR